MNQPTFTERATLVLIGWFIGWFCAGVLALLTFTGCWTGTPPTAEAPITRHVVVRHWECERLKSVGPVPPQADVVECIDGDPDNYWSCAAHRYEAEARALRDWTLTARAVCE